MICSVATRVAAVMNAPSLTSLLEWRSPDLLGRLQGGVTGFEGGTWSLRGSGSLSGGQDAAQIPPGSLVPLLGESAQRRRQLEGFARLDEEMAIGDERPSERAARVAIETYEAKTGRKAHRQGR